MKNFIDRLNEKNTVIEKVAQELKESKHPLILYGAGFWAKQQYQLLKAHGVSFQAIAIDEKYYTGKQNFDEYEIQTTQNALKSYPEANIFIGFSLARMSLIKIKEELNSKFHINDIYAFDCASDGLFKGHNYSYSKILKNASAFNKLFSSLADEKSKESMLSYFNQRISGDYIYSEKCFDPDHYFSKDIIHLNKKEIFVDCGAYTGDTIEDLLSRCIPQRVYAFEPDHANFKILSKKFKGTPCIICIPKGAYKQKDELHFNGNCADASKICNEGKTIIPTDSIDNITVGDKVSFIKMDIEGAELDALKGAEKTIKKNHPKLAISAYHKFEDLLEIPKFIQVIDPSYKFYLRRHSHLVHELVLYAL